jgi:hypothetical protein
MFSWGGIVTQMLIRDGTVAVLRTRRDDGNTTPDNVVVVFLQPLHLVFNCYADGL